MPSNLLMFCLKPQSQSLYSQSVLYLYSVQQIKRLSRNWDPLPGSAFGFSPYSHHDNSLCLKFNYMSYEDYWGLSGYARVCWDLLRSAGVCMGLLRSAGVCRGLLVNKRIC